MELQRAKWREKKLRRSKMTAILKATKSGLLWQMPRTDRPIGLSRVCSTEAELREVPRRQTSKLWDLNGLVPRDAAQLPLRMAPLTNVVNSCRFISLNYGNVHFCPKANMRSSLRPLG